MTLSVCRLLFQNLSTERSHVLLTGQSTTACYCHLKHEAFVQNQTDSVWFILHAVIDKCVIVLTLCPSWQEDPKSTILMADLLGLHSRMFSGFRSQWMIDSSGVARNNNAVDPKDIILIVPSAPPSTPLTSEPPFTKHCAPNT